MKKKVIGIVFSDLHISDYQKFNADGKRTLNHIRVLFLIKEVCNKYKCPAFFCGDFMHKPENISTELEEIIIDKFNELRGDDNFNIYGISGNHDMCHSNTKEKRSPSHWKNFCNKYHFLHNIDFSYHMFDSVIVHGIPYLDHNIGLNDAVKNFINNRSKFPGFKHILLLHTDYPGAKDNDGIEVGSVENLNINLLSKFDLVLIGHIHKPQRLSKKIFMIGAPLQQRRTDRDADLGYWKIFEDLSMQFVPFDCFPQFIDVESDEEVKDDGNYYTVIGKAKEIENINESNKITRDLTKTKLVSRYLKTKGIKDPEKKALLVNIIKEAEND